MTSSNSLLPPDWDLNAYHFDLPSELIAQHPTDKRDHSRMMVLSPNTPHIAHHHFYDLLDFLPEHSALVVNNTKVLPSRLLGQRETGGAIEALLLEEKEPGHWETMVKRAKRIKPGERLSFGDHQILAIAHQRLANGHWLLMFEDPDTLLSRLEQFALSPLPPYIDRSQANDTDHQNDRKRYQTCFAAKPGAIAAPTAGLHFTPDILDRLRHRGIPLIEVTLHVGIGTFAPLRSQDIRQHPIHSEYFEVSTENMALLQQAINEQRKLVAVGTTSVRVLETLAQDESFSTASGWTNLYLYPPYRFRLVHGLLTNFHLPGSTLLLLVSALYGREPLLNAYQTAIDHHYRFFSYGDCMLIL